MFLATGCFGRLKAAQIVFTSLMLCLKVVKYLRHMDRDYFSEYLLL